MHYISSSLRILIAFCEKQAEMSEN